MKKTQILTVLSSTIVTVMLAGATTVYAGTVVTTPNFATGDPISSSAMNTKFDNVKTAVDDNHNRLTNVETNKQNRVTGTCTAGSAVSAVNANGTVTCVPGAAAGTVLLSGSTNSTTAVQLDSFTVTTPGAGTLWVHISGQFWFDVDATSTTALFSNGTVGLCETSASMTGCTSDYVYYEDPDNTNVSNVTFAFTLTRMYTVSAGAKTLYLNGLNYYGHSMNLWGPTTATVIYFPANALSVTSP